jgi:hypothetical protein
MWLALAHRNPAKQVGHGKQQRLRCLLNDQKRFTIGVITPLAEQCGMHDDRTQPRYANPVTGR